MGLWADIKIGLGVVKWLRQEHNKIMRDLSPGHAYVVRDRLSHGCRVLVAGDKDPEFVELPVWLRKLAAITDIDNQLGQFGQWVLDGPDGGAKAGTVPVDMRLAASAVDSPRGG